MVLPLGPADEFTKAGSSAVMPKCMYGREVRLVLAGLSTNFRIKAALTNTSLVPEREPRLIAVSGMLIKQEIPLLHFQPGFGRRDTSVVQPVTGP